VLLSSGFRSSMHGGLLIGCLLFFLPFFFLIVVHSLLLAEEFILYILEVIMSFLLEASETLRHEMKYLRYFIINKKSHK